MGTTHYACGCYITRSMFGAQEIEDFGHCWQHRHLYDQDKTPRQMAQEIQAQDHTWRQHPIFDDSKDVAIA